MSPNAGGRSFTHQGNVTLSVLGSAEADPVSSVFIDSSHVLFSLLRDEVSLMGNSFSNLEKCRPSVSG
jgi:hypothetical protein